MASEDSRYRDRARRFIRSVTAAIRWRPSSWRCAPACIICRTEANASKSACFAVASEWVFFEARHDHRHQVAPSLHGETKQRVAMVVVASVLDDLPAPEHLLEEFQCRPRRRCLGDRELVLDLPAEKAPGIAHDRDREAALAVDEADDPLFEPWPFLLIARTGRIVTAHGRTLLRGWDTAVPPDARGFQHIADCTRRVAAPRGRTWCTARSSTLVPL